MNSNSDSNTRDIKTLFSLLKKDLKLEFRSLSTILITIVFTALIVVLFNIAFPFGVAQKNSSTLCLFFPYCQLSPNDPNRRIHVPKCGL